MLLAQLGRLSLASEVANSSASASNVTIYTNKIAKKHESSHHRSPKSAKTGGHVRRAEVHTASVDRAPVLQRDRLCDVNVRIN